MNPYTLPEGNVLIAFSGGRTSAYMLHQILEANGDLPDRCVVSFQNTGREMPETLDFVQECGERWGVRIVWLEYRPSKPLFEVVSHNSASRNGEPFDALISRRKMLPNQSHAVLHSGNENPNSPPLLLVAWLEKLDDGKGHSRRRRPQGNTERRQAHHELASALRCGRNQKNNFQFLEASDVWFAVAALGKRQPVWKLRWVLSQVRSRQGGAYS